MPSVGAMNVWTAPWSTVMRLETKYLRLCTAVTLGSRFGDWCVCWRGGWSRHRLFYLVMLVRVEPRAEASPICAPVEAREPRPLIRADRAAASAAPSAMASSFLRPNFEPGPV